LPNCFSSCSPAACRRKGFWCPFRKLQDARAGLEVFAGAALSQDLAVADSERARCIALNRYTGGLVTYLDVVTAQQSLLSNQRRAAPIQGGQLVASVM